MIDKNSKPLDYIISCCEQGLIPSTFDTLNAKDELKKLRSKIDSFDIVGWARINSDGYPYDLRLHYNPYLDQNIIMPLYYDKSSYRLWKNDNKQ